MGSVWETFREEDAYAWGRATDLVTSWMSYRQNDAVTAFPGDIGLDPREEILGVGFAAVRPDKALPALFVNAERVEGREEAETNLRPRLAQVMTLNGTPVVIIRLRPAQRFAALGDGCQGPVMSGTIGARVITSSGSLGVLTAGHVGGSTGAVMTDAGGNRLGHIVDCLDTTMAAPNVISPDVAVIELSPGVVCGGVPHSSVSATARLRDDIQLHGAVSGVTQDWVNGVSVTWAGPDPASGDWGVVLLTRAGTTDLGDSGGPVLKVGTTQLVGHIVGGDPGQYSLVQEIDYQLGNYVPPPARNVPGVVPGLSGVALR
jgi:hypothetical protein